MNQPQRQLGIHVPDTVADGVYANGANVWHTPYEFTIDFGSFQPPNPQAPNVLPARVVSRVKIPPTVIFDLMRAMNQNMTRYEAQFGEIKRIEPQSPPADNEEGGDEPSDD